MEIDFKPAELLEIVKMSGSLELQIEYSQATKEFTDYVISQALNSSKGTGLTIGVGTSLNPTPFEIWITAPEQGDIDPNDVAVDSAAYIILKSLAPAWGADLLPGATVAMSVGQFVLMLAVGRCLEKTGKCGYFRVIAPELAYLTKKCTVPGKPAPDLEPEFRQKVANCARMLWLWRRGRFLVAGAVAGLIGDPVTVSAADEPAAQLDKRAYHELCASGEPVQGVRVAASSTSQEAAVPSFVRLTAMASDYTFFMYSGSKYTVPPNEVESVFCEELVKDVPTVVGTVQPRADIDPAAVQADLIALNWTAPEAASGLVEGFCRIMLIHSKCPHPVFISLAHELAHLYLNIYHWDWLQELAVASLASLVGSSPLSGQGTEYFDAFNTKQDSLFLEPANSGVLHASEQAAKFKQLSGKQLIRFALEQYSNTKVRKSLTGEQEDGTIKKTPNETIRSALVAAIGEMVVIEGVGRIGTILKNQPVEMDLLCENGVRQEHSEFQVFPGLPAPKLPIGDKPTGGGQGLTSKLVPLSTTKRVGHRGWWSRSFTALKIGNIAGGKTGGDLWP